MCRLLCPALTTNSLHSHYALTKIRQANSFDYFIASVLLIRQLYRGHLMRGHWDCEN